MQSVRMAAWTRRVGGLAVVVCVGIATLVPPFAAAQGQDPNPIHEADGWKAAAAAAGRDAAAISKLQVGNQAQYDALHYTLWIVPSFQSATIHGVVVITLRSLVNGLDHIDLDLYNTMIVSSVREDAVPLTFTHVANRLSVTLRRPLSASEQTALSIDYGGAPQPAGFMGMQFRSHDGQPILATLSEPYYARSWWPCKDVPDDKTSVRLSCLVPASMYCASNGVLVSEVPDGQGNVLYTWEENYPISPYLVSIAATNYVGWSESYVSPLGHAMTLEYKVFPEHLAAAHVDFAHTSEMIDLYATLFGEYPFIRDKYGMAEFVWNGAMEHQTMTSYGNTLITGTQQFERLVGHELSHQWWGNLLSLTDWNDVWLNEGFATYCEALWLEHSKGTATARSYLNGHSAPFSGPVTPPEALFNYTVYFKGAWVLHMLRHVLGDNDFFRSMRAYAALPQQQYGNVRTADFVAAVEGTIGRPLGWFFDEWLYRSDRPVYDMQWSTQPSGDRTRVDVTIRQTQPGAPYVMPLEVVIDTPTGSQTFETWNESAVQITTYMVDAPPTAVSLDPNDYVLGTDSSQQTPTAVRPAGSALRVELLPNAPNPFNPSTLLRFSLASVADVQMTIHDTRGRIVRRLRLDELQPGLHEVRWNGEDDAGAAVASGVYYVRLQAPGTDLSRPVDLVR